MIPRVQIVASLAWFALAALLVAGAGCGEGTRELTSVPAGKSAQQAIPPAIVAQIFRHYPKEMVDQLVKLRQNPQVSSSAPAKAWSRPLGQNALSQTTTAPKVISGPLPRFPEVGGFGYFTSINNVGDGVGVLVSSFYAGKGFYWHDKGGGVEPGLWGLGDDTWLSGINDDGVVVGTMFYPPNLATYRAFRWDRIHGMMLLPLLPHRPIDGYWYDSAWARAFAINKYQVIAGSSSYQVCPEIVYQSDPSVCTDWRLTAGPPCPCSPAHPTCSNDNYNGVLYSAGGSIQGMGSLPPQSVVCSGLDRWCGRYNGAIYGSSTLLAINSAGHSVGWSTAFPGSGFCDPPVGGHYHAWAPGTYGDLNPPGAEESIAQGINDRDQVVGFAFDGRTYEYYAVLWESGFATRLPGLGAPAHPGWQLAASGEIATGINNNGYIIGNSWGADGFHGVVRKPDGTIVDLGVGAIPHALNDKNQVAGAVVYRDWTGAEFSHPAIWDLGSDIVVNVTISPDHVGPVYAQCFDAETQTQYVASKGCASEDVSPALRPDVVQVRISATEAGGSAARGGTVELVAKVEYGSGGHQHGTAQSRPLGTFFPDATQSPDSGSRGRINVPLSSDGTAVVYYVTSGVSGVEGLEATVTSASGETGKGEARVGVQVDDLKEVPRTGTTYVFKDPGTAHPQNNFGTAQLQDASIACFSAYMERMDREALRYFLDGSSKFVITEIGLPLGGMLDMDEDWIAPHQTHRFGRQLDLRSQQPGSSVKLLDPYRFKVLQWYCSQRELGVAVEGNHYHLSLGAP